MGNKWKGNYDSIKLTFDGWQGNAQRNRESEISEAIARYLREISAPEYVHGEGWPEGNDPKPKAHVQGDRWPESKPPQAHGDKLKPHVCVCPKEGYNVAYPDNDGAWRCVKCNRRICVG